MILLTFVFGYIANRAVSALSGRIPRFSRRTLVGCVFIVGVGALAGLGAILGPHVHTEQRLFTERFPQMRENVARWIEDAQKDYPRLLQAVDPGGSLPEEVRHFEPAKLFKGALKSEGETPAGDVSPLVIDVARTALRFASTLILSLLFSFLILFDLPRLQKEVEAIRASRIGWLYNEVRGTIVEFGGTLGQVIEAQMLIAIVNTVSTFVGLLILGVPSKFLLSTIAFFCSFVPVLGVFISTIPICMVALTQGGFGLVLQCIAMVAVVHAIEAYGLNPRITGARVRLNPVMVLVILVVGEHLFGLWGVILGVPVAVTLLRRTRTAVSPS